MNTESRHIATEQRTFEEVLENLALNRQWLKTVITRLKSVAKIPDHARVLEIGAAGGGNLVTLKHLGFEATGIEPSEEALRNASQLSRSLGVHIEIVGGAGEAVPFESEKFDLVCAFSVIEHVRDVEQVFKEIARVLKPGGIFWFSAASAMSPRQNEIRGFPFFGWYPDTLKRRIMYWAKETKPHLIGYTQTPAIHWFTPGKARTLLQKHGFKEIKDRWDLRGKNESGRIQGIALEVIRSTRIFKGLADIVVPTCSFSAIKG